jgi:hypothetical protein
MIDQLSVMVLLLLGLAQLLVSSGQQHSSTITSPVLSSHWIWLYRLAAGWHAMQQLSFQTGYHALHSCRKLTAAISR